jgi:hypothetical protein
MPEILETIGGQLPSPLADACPVTLDELLSEREARCGHTSDEYALQNQTIA